MPKVFVSGTSKDLKSYRQVVVQWAKDKEYEYFEQTDFETQPDFVTVTRLIRDKLAPCDAVVHLVGLYYGFEPSDRPGTQARRSYTQLEYELGRAFICELGMSISQYHDEWRKHEKDVLEWHDRRAMKYPRSVAATWETSVSRFSEETRGLMRVLCWLAPDPVPLTMLEKLTAEEGELSISGTLCDC